jgi:hypothetical protein
MPLPLSIFRNLAEQGTCCTSFRNGNCFVSPHLSPLPPSPSPPFDYAQGRRGGVTCLDARSPLPQMEEGAGGWRQEKARRLCYNAGMQTSAGLTWVAGERTPEKTYITRVLNLGTWEEWQALKRSVPEERIRDAVQHPLRGQWTKRGKSFAECIFECEMPDDVLISYDV